MKFSTILYIYVFSYIHLLKRKFKYTEHTVNRQVPKICIFHCFWSSLFELIVSLRKIVLKKQL